jgi:GntR family histidine utilization transcriptional repressor
MLLQTEAVADEKIANALEIDAGSGVYHIKLIHLESGLPIQVEDRFVLPEFSPDILVQDFREITPSAYMSAISPLQEAEHVVRAQMPDDDIRVNLGMSKDEPCLVVTRRTWAYGRPVSLAHLYHPGSRFELSGHYDPTTTKPRQSRRHGGAGKE